MNFLNTNIKTKFHYVFLLLIILMNLSILAISTSLYNLNTAMDNLETTTVIHHKKPIKVEPIKVKINYTVREVSAYNVGIVGQNDASPCVGAGNHELCSLVNSGKLVCAANFVPLHTKLTIEGIGECEVLDRMNSRYKNRVDLAMRQDELSRALHFGIQKLKIAIN